MRACIWAGETSRRQPGLNPETRLASVHAYGAWLASSRNEACALHAYGRQLASCWVGVRVRGGVGGGVEPL